MLHEWFSPNIAAIMLVVTRAIWVGAVWGAIIPPVKYWVEFVMTRVYQDEINNIVTAIPGENWRKFTKTPEMNWIKIEFSRANVDWSKEKAYSCTFAMSKKNTTEILCKGSELARYALIKTKR
jgi:hypothetical protein